MKYVITAFPIDRKFQEKLGIYYNPVVYKEHVGFLITSLIENGYTNINSYEEKGTFYFHCTAK